MILKSRNCIISISIILFSLIFLVFISDVVKAEPGYKVDYQTFIIKDLYFAVNFDNENDRLELIMPDGSREVLQQQISASGAKYGNEKITFWNKGKRSQISIMGKIIFDTDRVEADSKLKNEFTEDLNQDINLKDAVFLKSRSLYLILEKRNNKARFVIDGQEFMLDKETGEDQCVDYNSEDLQIFEQSDGLLINIDDYRFSAEKVSLDDFPTDEELKLRGLGQEPGWLMRLQKDEIELELDYAQVKINVQAPYFEIREGKEEIIYDVMTSLVDFEIQIIKEVHRDIMSGRIFPYTVKIKADDRELIGGAYIAN